MLMGAYPNHHWDKEKFKSRNPKKSSQWQLCKVLKHLVPTAEVLEDFVHPYLYFYDSGAPMVFDICIPSLKLVFEYQGYQHFQDHYLFGDASKNKRRDNEKYNACTSVGFTLLKVPYWWNHDKESILSLLCKSRPDIFCNTYC